VAAQARFRPCRAGIPQIVPRLEHRRTRVALSVLGLVQVALDVLELADDLRCLREAGAKLADGKVRFAGAAPGSGAGDREFRVKMVALSPQPIGAIAPGLDEEPLDERTFGLGFAAEFTPAPVRQPLAQRLILAARAIVLIFIMQLGLQEFSVEQRLETVGRHCPFLPGGFEKSYRSTASPQNSIPGQLREGPGWIG
jgi:hypothetical protein